MSDIKKRIFKIFGVVWAICLVTLLVYYFFLVGPKLKQYNSVKSELTKLQSPDSMHQNEKKVKDQLEYCKKLKSQLADFVIDNDGWINMMPYVSGIARGEKVSGFTGKDMSGGQFEGYDKLEKVGVKTLSVNYKASFLKFARFINQLESGQPVIFVKSFSIERNPDDFNSNSVKMDLRVIVGKSDGNVNKAVAMADFSGSN